MRHRPIAVALLIGFILVAGCRSSGKRNSSRNMDRPSETKSVRAESDALGKIVSDIQGAQSAQREADALRRLRKYESDNGLTYTVNSFRVLDMAEVSDASTRRDPVRVEVTIFRGRDTVRTFNFIPRDNRNLTVMGE